MLKLFLYLILVCSACIANAQLFVNEVMSSNRAAYSTNGKFYDWVEIYNSSSSPIDLAGYYVSDDPAAPLRYRLPSQIGQNIVPANGFFILWANGLENLGSNFLNFSLSASGESFILTAPDAITTIDQITFPALRPDVSYGRSANGGSTLVYFSPSSPNATNVSANGYVEVLDPPLFSQNGGFFSANFNLSISHPDPTVSIFYTTDGSTPVGNTSTITYTYKNTYKQASTDPPTPFLTDSYQSIQYSAPIPISDRTSQPNRTSLKSSVSNNFNFFFPNYNLYKATTVRAVATKLGALTSEVVTQTYFYSNTGQSQFSFPVVSVVVQESDLFDYNNGIYTAGVGFENNNVANFNLPSEKNANVEFYFSSNQVINQSIGLRIHGGSSVQIPQKSLRLYSTSSFDYPLFSEKPSTQHRRLILRNSGNDWGYTMFKDAFYQSLVSHMNFSYQAFTPSITFLNGEYWGISNIRERLDRFYVQNNYGVDSDSVDMVAVETSFMPRLEEGDMNAYNSFVQFLNSKSNFSNNNDYSTLQSYMDIDSFIDYYIAQMFCDNKDWPYNNVLLWRKKVGNNIINQYGHDGRWRWMIYDTDYGIGFDGTDPTAYPFYVVNNTSPLMYSKFMANITFRNKFINRFADMLNTTYLPTRMTAQLATLKQKYFPEMQAHINRWERPFSIADWENKITNVGNWLNERPNWINFHMRNEYNISGHYNLTVNVSDVNQGYIKVNSIDIIPNRPGITSNPYPWTGQYYNNIPLTIKAIGKPGYQFSHWILNNNQIYTDEITLNTNQSQSYTAVFEEVFVSDNPSPLAQNLQDPCGYVFTEWSNAAPVGSFPANMKFVYMNTEEPTLSATIEANTSGAYNFTSRTRITGHGSLGFSFINTSGSVNAGYPNTRLGGAVLAINTVGKTNITVQWKGRTMAIGTRKYKIRLQARYGDLRPFEDVLGSDNQPIEYASGATVGDSLTFVAELPPSLLSRPYVQLFWRYYYTGIGTSGSRDQLAVDDINVFDNQLIETASLLAQPITTAINAAQKYITIYDCKLIAKIEPNGTNPITGRVITKLFFNTPTATFPYISRHFEISPQPYNIANNFTAKITLYFTQAEFDAHNNLNINQKLPLNSLDVEEYKQNIRIVKYPGESTDGLPNSYGTTPVVITPNVSDIIWAPSLDAEGGRWEVSFFTEGFSGFLAKGADIAAPLPLQLVNFDVKMQEQSHLLYWVTSHEVNVDHFEIQSKIDGEFQKIGKQNLNETGKYEFIVVPNIFHATNYYRLMIVDKDGGHQYSEIKAIQNQNLVQKPSIWPNPVINNIIQINNLQQNRLYDFYIFDQNGKLIFTKNGIEASNKQTYLSLPTLPASQIFFLKMKDNLGQYFTQKFILTLN